MGNFIILGMTMHSKLDILLSFDPVNAMSAVNGMSVIFQLNKNGEEVASKV